MTALIAQLVAVLCAELGVPALTGPLTTVAMQLAAMIPEAKLEAVVFAVMKEGAKWLITRPPGPEPTPDFGGNTACPTDGPPAETRPEPEDGRDPPP
jgi:hypothetical protein